MWITKSRSAVTLLSVLALPACFVVGLLMLRQFLIYSFAAGGLAGLTGYERQYSDSRWFQIFTLLAFGVTQLIGGICLRLVLRSWRVTGFDEAGRAGSALLSGGFTAFTLACFFLLLRLKQV